MHIYSYRMDRLNGDLITGRCFGELDLRFESRQYEYGPRNLLHYVLDSSFSATAGNSSSPLALSTCNVCVSCIVSIFNKQDNQCEVICKMRSNSGFLPFPENIVGQYDEPEKMRR